ncbi:MAG: tetratricopeptide repeat protein, partial [Flavobacteriaceae bacterium]|nr:tetratricopeptide repeat protein [Flavobacteriaceae bacterium]
MRLILILITLPILGFSQNSYDEIENLFFQKKYLQAQKLMEKQVEDYPNDIKAWELLGDAHGHQENWEEAIEIYKKLVDTNPRSANYQYKYGGSLGMKALSVNKLRALLLVDDIREAFTKAAELDKNHIDARWALTEFYMKLPGILGGSTTKALEYAQELENISKVDGYLAKGNIYEQDNEPDLAEEYYRKAIKEGGSLTCYDKLSTFYENQKKPTEAIANLEQAQEVHKRNALHYQIGKVAAEYRISLDKGEKCLITYINNYSVADGVPIPWARYRLAQIYKYQGNKAAALQNINLAISDLPKIDTFKEEKEQ